MRNEPSIASVTLAYNFAQGLPRQLDALLAQRRPLDEIIVVNNGSSDGTSEILSGKYPQVKVLNLPANAGTGGGYAAGLQYAALDRKHDWVWLLDHDSVPKPDTLATLLDALADLGDGQDTVGMLAPSPVHAETNVEYSGLLWQGGWVPARASGPTPCDVDVVISSGSLIRSKVVREVGLPRADFFIDFVDFEYCLRIRRRGYKIVVAGKSHLEHTIGSPRVMKFLGFSKIWAVHDPWREYYMSRNETFTIWLYYPDWKSKLSVFRRLLRHATAIVAFGKQKGFCLKMMALGFLDGRAGRLGIRF